MPRMKKKIEVIVHVPLDDHYKGFQNRIDEVYTDSIRYLLKQMKLNRDEKLKLIDELLKK